MRAYVVSVHLMRTSAYHSYESRDVTVETTLDRNETTFDMDSPTVNLLKNVCLGRAKAIIISATNQAYFMCLKA